MDPLRAEDNRNFCIVLDAMVVESQKQSQEVGAMIPEDLDRAVVKLCASEAKVIPLPPLVEANKEDLTLNRLEATSVLDTKGLNDLNGDVAFPGHGINIPS